MRIHERVTRDLRTLRTLGRMLPNIVRARPSASFTVADAIEEVANRRPNQLALVFENATFSYSQLDREANRVARWAQARNLRRGDVVALLMENRPEFVIHWLGLAKIGAVTALINTNLLGKPLAHSLAISGARHLILDTALVESWESAQPDLERPLEVWTSGGEIPGANDLDAARAEASPARLPSDVRAGLKGADKLFYIYTSGTTGLPKAANFSHTRFVAISSGGSALAGLSAADRMYIVLPLYHSAGGAMALGGTLLSGATAVLGRKFSASRFWEDCVRHDVTAFQYIGELCRYLLNSPPHPDEQRHRIRVCVGNGLRPEVWQPFQERFAIARIVEFYGATEGNVTFTNLDNRVGSVGRMPALMRRVSGVHLVRFDVEKEDVVRGVDGFCVECAIDEPGEAIGRLSDTARFEGYTDPKASEKKILHDVFAKGDSYFRTGDLLRRDADDYFYFVDRIGDTFRWKGENVSTGEVAEILSTCPGVREANVYGVEVPGADGRAGMTSLVVDEDFDLETFYAEIEGQLPTYARPLFLRIGTEIEITGTFKHRKVEAMKEGFDPACSADPLYVLDAKQGRYVPLDAALHTRIQSGEIRL